MTAFLITISALIITDVLYKAILLSITDYPRNKKYTSAEDVTGMLINIGLLFWLAFLLWGVQ
jgi:hypothetical protein